MRLHQVDELAPQEAIDRNPLWRQNQKATRDIPMATPDDLDWAEVIIFSFPTRFGNMASQMKQFIDITGPLWARGKLVNKVVSAMSSAKNLHGGQESALLSLYRSMLHWGSIVVSPGYIDEAASEASGGNPYGTTASENEDGGVEENLRPAVEYQVRRALQIARWLKAGREAETERLAGATPAAKG